MMTLAEEELTQKEANRLYTLSAIPAVLVFAIVTVYYSFVHLDQLPPSQSLMWDLLLNLLPLTLIGMPTTFLLTFEILCNRKLRSTANFHIKRFLGRMATVLFCAMLFFASYLLSYSLLVPLVSERGAILSSFLLWLLLILIFLSKFKLFFNKLEKGTW
jgi:hypothetical protein